MTNPTTPQTEPTQEAMDLALIINGFSSPKKLRTALIIQAALDKREAETKAYWYRQGKDDGAQSYQDSIVAWLRAVWPPSSYPDDWPITNAAERIERGEHKEPKQ